MQTASISTRLHELGFQATSSADTPRVAPASAQAAADLLGECNREGWTVRLTGRGSRGGDDAPADVLVSSEALHGFDIYVPEDLTVGVLAGTPHGWLDAQLAAARQCLTLDPPATDASTLGGTVALAAAGPLRAAYGTPRDLVLGIQAVTGDGRMLRLGGQVVKNVAGYDLVRLLNGSRGTLAFITQVHVRLRSLPATDRTVIAPVRDHVGAAAQALAFRQTLHPAALEVLGPRRDLGWRLALRFQGSAPATADAVERVRQAVPAAAPLDAPAAAEFWNELRRAEAVALTRIRIEGQPGDLEKLLVAASQVANSASDKQIGQWLLAAHGSDGIVRLAHPARSPGDGPRLAALLRAISSDLASRRGTCICEAGPDDLRAASPPHPPAAAVARLEAELRRMFDPRALLVGG